MTIIYLKNNDKITKVIIVSLMKETSSYIMVLWLKLRFSLSGNLKQEILNSVIESISVVILQYK